MSERTSEQKMVIMKRKLAKQLDDTLNALYNLRINGTIPTEEEEAIYQEVYTILYDDGLLESSTRGAEITEKGLAFMKKGGYIALWNKEMLNYGISFVIGACSGVVGCLITLYSN